MGKTASLANIGTIADSSLGFRNRIINGGMTVDQRNAGASVTLTSGALFITDRFYGYNSTSGAVMTGAQSSTAPAGFSKSLFFSVTTGASVGASDYTQFRQAIEGFNTADLAWGTASASAVTVSFWVRGSVTGTYGFCIMNNDGSRSYMSSYTISSANTWALVSTTIPGDTGGTWSTTNTGSLLLCWDLGCGSNRSISVTGAWQTSTFKDGLTGGTKLIATTGANLYITGVQLEKGSTATSFDYRPIGTELQLCQRYFETFNNSSGVTQNLYLGYVIGGSAAWVNSPFVYQVTKRATPTVTTSNLAGVNFTFTAANASVNYVSLQFTSASAGTTQVYVLNGNTWLTVSAEL